jgi:serine/threonine protein kinase
MATQKPVAIKALSKKRINELGMFPQVQREKTTMLAAADHPHMINLYATSTNKQNDDNLYFFMEVAANGNLDELMADYSAGTIHVEIIRGYAA